MAQCLCVCRQSKKEAEPQHSSTVSGRIVGSFVVVRRCLRSALRPELYPYLNVSEDLAGTVVHVVDLSSYL